MEEISLQVEANAHAPRVSRTYLAGMQSSLGPRFNDVALVLSELVTNSVLYGTGTDDVDVLVDATKGRIRLEVSDAGPCFDKDDPRGNGMGLDIVDQIADDWGVQRDHKCTVWVEIIRES
jgi:anti-sigma regulatory factor (Ser/Thr protein kinase)